MAAAIRLSQQHSCYLETESELSCGSPDFDLITEVSDAVCEPGCGFGRVATGEVFGAEVLVEPISKPFEEDHETCKLDKAEEIVGVVLPANEDPALPLNPGEEALNEPASHVAA